MHMFHSSSTFVLSDDDEKTTSKHFEILSVETKL